MSVQEQLAGLGIGFYAFLVVSVPIILIIMGIKTYLYIRRTAKNSEKLLFDIEQINKHLTAQYTMEHCYMNRFQPHDWYPTGNQTDTHWEFTCSKCGQIIDVPKVQKK